MRRIALNHTAKHLRDRAAEFDRLARRVRDSELRAQFQALKRRFERCAERAGAGIREILAAEEELQRPSATPQG